jgi:hypothetical protein
MTTDYGFDIDTARPAPEDAGLYDLSTLPAPGEDPNGSTLVPVPTDLAARLAADAAQHGRSLREELIDRLGRTA